MCYLKGRKFIFITVVLICFSSVIYYHKPIHVTKEYNGVVYKNDKYDNTLILIEITIRRKLFSVNHVDGEIDINNETYLLSNNKVFTDDEKFPIINSQSIFQELKSKLTDNEYRLFYRTPDDVLANVDISKDYSYLTGYIISEGILLNFMAPANNKDDVKKMSEKIFNNNE